MLWCLSLGAGFRFNSNDKNDLCTRRSLAIALKDTWWETSLQNILFCRLLLISNTWANEREYLYVGSSIKRWSRFLLEQYQRQWITLYLYVIPKVQAKLNYVCIILNFLSCSSRYVRPLVTSFHPSKHVLELILNREYPAAHQCVMQLLVIGGTAFKFVIPYTISILSPPIFIWHNIIVITILYFQLSFFSISSLYFSLTLASTRFLYIFVHNLIYICYAKQMAMEKYLVFVSQYLMGAVPSFPSCVFVVSYASQFSTHCIFFSCYTFCNPRRNEPTTAAEKESKRAGKKNNKKKSCNLFGTRKMFTTENGTAASSQSVPAHGK